MKGRSHAPHARRHYSASVQRLRSLPIGRGAGRQLGFRLPEYTDYLTGVLYIIYRGGFQGRPCRPPATQP